MFLTVTDDEDYTDGLLLNSQYILSIYIKASLDKPLDTYCNTIEIDMYNNQHLTLVFKKYETLKNMLSNIRRI